MASLLEEIVAAKRQEVQRRRAAVPESQLRERLESAPPVRDFFAAIERDRRVSLIAEVKKASPSRGVIREAFDPLQIAAAYAQHGATCISVLTDEPYFQGRLEYLAQIRAAGGPPLLRKDFILDTYQLLEARTAGADAVLLIAECLEDCQLRRLHNETLELGMTPLVEFYRPENCQRVLDAGAMLVGVNNRDLTTFQTDLQHTLRMREQIPADRLLVAESGIRTRQDVEQLARSGVNAMLVGEHLMSQDDVGAAVRALLQGA